MLEKEMENELTEQKDLESELYFKCLQLEQENTRIRWTVATFFMSVSFALFGFSFQTGVSTQFALIVRVSGLTIYWFAFILFLRFNNYNNFLRGYIKEMEISKRVKYDLQIQALSVMGKRFHKWFSANRLLFYFGLLYSAVVWLVWKFVA
jgi:hypothetical protein